MNRLLINLDELRYNIATVNKWMAEHNSSWTVVTKVLCGHTETLQALQYLGIRSMGDSRLENLKSIERIMPDFEAWYLRVPDITSVPDVVKYSDVSLNSEIEVIRELNNEARRQNKIHRIIIMIELGDLREGILPGSLMNFYNQVFELPNIEVLGIGSNLGCLAGAIPNMDQFMQLVLYRELLELKFKQKLTMISAGSTVVLPLVINKQLPGAVNHFRIGEAIFLGTDLIRGGTLPGLSNEVMLLEAEIAEIKEKSLVPLGETGSGTSPFDFDSEEEAQPGRRGYRALISVGQLDTDISGLTPLNDKYRLAGASSDIAVVNIGDDPGDLKVGDTIKFRVNYSALLRLMSGKYIEKQVIPNLDIFREEYSSEGIEVHPVMEQVDRED